VGSFGHSVLGCVEDTAPRTGNFFVGIFFLNPTAMKLIKLVIIAIISLIGFLSYRSAPTKPDIEENAPLITGYGIFEDRIEITAYLPKGLREAEYTIPVSAGVLRLTAPGKENWKPGTTIKISAPARGIIEANELPLTADGTKLYTIRVRAKNELFEYVGPRDAGMREGIQNKTNFEPVEVFTEKEVVDTTTERVPTAEEIEAKAAAQKDLEEEKARQDALINAVAVGRKYKGKLEPQFSDGTGRGQYFEAATVTFEITGNRGRDFSGKVVESSSRIFSRGVFSGVITEKGLRFNFNINNKNRTASAFSFELVPEDGFLVGTWNRFDTLTQTGSNQEVRFEALPFTPAVPAPPVKDTTGSLPEWKRPFANIVVPGCQLVGRIPGPRWLESVNMEISEVETDGKFRGFYENLHTRHRGTFSGAVREAEDGKGDLVIALDNKSQLILRCYGDSILGDMTAAKGEKKGEVKLRVAKSRYSIAKPIKKQNP